MKKNNEEALAKYEDLIRIIEEIEEKYRDLSENIYYGQQLANVGCWSFDMERKQVDYSQETCFVLGLDPEKFQGELEQVYEKVHEEDLTTLKEFFAGEIREKESFIEFRVAGEGEELDTHRHVCLKTKPLFNKEGKVRKIIGVVDDITLLRQKSQRLAELREHHNLIPKVSGIGTWKYVVPDGKYFGSDELLKIYGVEENCQATGMDSVLHYVHPEDHQSLMQAMEQCLKGKGLDMEYRIIRSDGGVRYVVAKGEPYQDETGLVTEIHGVLQDVTEAREYQIALFCKQEEIYHMQRRFQVMVQESSDVFKIITPEGMIKYVSDASNKVMGYPPEHLQEQSIFSFCSIEEGQKLKDMIDYVLSNPAEKVRRDITFNKESGALIHFSVSLQNLIEEPSINGLVMNFRNITKRVESERKMSYASTHDELTDLPNGLFFSRLLNYQLQKAKSADMGLTLFMMDIDGLKNINYTLGYEYCNKLIIQLVNQLKQTLGKRGYLCRYSDDIFTLLISHVKGQEDTQAIAQEILSIFSRNIRVDNFEVGIAVNLGITDYTEGSMDEELMVKQAKLSLLRAKKEGKNRYRLYTAEMDEKNYKEFTLRNEMHLAVQRNQLRLYYQPIVNINSNRLLAAEALLRWEHPEWGLVPPMEFIPIAEETGLIIEIGKWILNEVCENYKNWSKIYPHSIQISVNFSSIQFMEENFVDMVIRTIRSHQVDPGFLIFEITESILMENNDKVMADIRRLRAAGIKVALDDFGTGFSSLSYLSTFNIDFVKLDGAFVRNIPADEKSNVITKTMVNLTRDLNLKLIVEGIENWNQLEFVRDLECQIGQGFLYNRPLPQEEFEAILLRGENPPS